ncbi:hypothetical protein CUN85_12965, partial [Methanolobus halotolerans]
PPFLRKGGIIYHYFTEKELELLFRGFDIGEIRSIMTEKIFRGVPLTPEYFFSHDTSDLTDIEPPEQQFEFFLSEIMIDYTAFPAERRYNLSLFH